MRSCVNTGDLPAWKYYLYVHQYTPTSKLEELYRECVKNRKEKKPVEYYDSLLRYRGRGVRV